MLVFTHIWCSRFLSTLTVLKSYIAVELIKIQEQIILDGIYKLQTLRKMDLTILKSFLKETTRGTELTE